MQNSFRDRFLPLLFAALLLVCQPFSRYSHWGAPGRLFCPTAAGAEEEWEDAAEWEDEEPTEEELEAARRASDVGDWGGVNEHEDRLWTILVYLDGDNNLEGSAIADLIEMQIGMQNVNDPNALEVIVLLDRAEDHVDWDGDWTGTRVYRVFPSENDEDIDQEVLHDCGELNMASPQTLENFISEGMRVFPASRTALVVWNHGGGWAGLVSDDDAPGTEDGYASMTLEDLRIALSRAAVHYPDGKLDLLALDMCLMGQAETLVAVAPYAKYLVASPPLEPGFGYDYAGMLPYFADGLETRNAAVGVVRTASQVYRDVGWQDASLAVYDLSKVGGLLSSFGELARKMNTLVPVAWSELTRSLFHSLRFSGREDLYRRYGTGTTSSIDLMDWLNRLRASSDPMLAKEFAKETEAVRQALADIILYTESGPMMKDSTGLAIYAPLREENYDEKYLGNSFAAYTGWAQALTDLHVEQKDNAGSPPRIAAVEFGTLDDGIIDPADTVEINPDAEALEADARFVKATVNGTNIMWVHAGFALSEDSDPDGRYFPALRVTVLGGEIVTPPGEARLRSGDGELPVFRDGRNEIVYELTPFLSWLANDSVRTLVSPQYLDASEPEQSVIFGEFRRADDSGEKWNPAVMYMDDRELSYIKVMTADEGGNIYQSSVLPEPGDLFRPLHSTHSPDGEVTEETGEPIVWAEDIRLVRTWPPEGRHIRILCMAESLAGEGADFYSDPIAVRWTAGGEDSEEENESSVRDRVGGVWSYFVNQH